MRKYFIIFILVIEIILILFLIWVGLTRATHNIEWLNISHRGYSIKVKENTLAAVKEAFKQSYNGVEIDVRQTKDGVVVLNHGKNVTGVIDGKKKTYTISKTNYKKLKKLVLMNDEEYGEIHISTLEEVLKYANEKSIELAIHLKVKDKKFLKKVAKMVVENNMSGKCLYNGVKDYDSQLKYILSKDKNARFRISYKYLFEEENNIFELLYKNQIAVVINASLLNEEIVNRIKESGSIFYISGVNNDIFKNIISFKPDYIEFDDNISINDLKNK